MFMSITLSAVKSPCRAVLSWHIHHNGVEYFGPADDFFAVPTLRILSETNESLHIHYHAGSCHLPDLPASDHEPWYDHGRGLPHVKVEQAPSSSRQNEELVPAAAFLYMAPTQIKKPRALAVYPPEAGKPEIFTLHEPRLPVQDLRHFDLSGDEPRHGPMFYRRFYPLKCPFIDGDDPADKDWRPSSLEGVWFGAYASHGTEVLYVYYDESERTVRAMKITGDLNVPRGVVTWQFSVDDRVSPDDLPHEPTQASAVFGPLESARIYRGIGTISGTGYMYVLSF